MLECPEEAWDKIFEINVKVSFLLFKECVPHMQVYSHVEHYYIWYLKSYFTEKRWWFCNFHQLYRWLSTNLCPGAIFSQQGINGHMEQSQFRHILAK